MTGGIPERADIGGWQVQGCTKVRADVGKARNAQGLRGRARGRKGSQAQRAVVRAMPWYCHPPNIRMWWKPTTNLQRHDLHLLRHYATAIGLVGLWAIGAEGELVLVRPSLPSDLVFVPFRVPF